MGVKISAKFNNESAESMLRRLRRRLDEMGWRKDLRRHEYFTSHGQERHQRRLQGRRQKAA